MLSGRFGEAVRQAMEIVVALGDIYDADRLIPIKSAHISGVSLRTSGEAAIEYVEGLAKAGAKVKVKTTINPSGTDFRRWRGMGTAKELVLKQLRAITAYRRMGARVTCSCTPYLTGNKPRFGEHLAWAESSAVVFANSVLGARTNREGSPSALAAAICGLTPRYGYHLEENRAPTVRIAPDPELFAGAGPWHYATLGYWIGANFSDAVPIIEGVRPTADQFKAMGAAMAASGAVALCHIPGVTAEAKRNPELCGGGERIGFGKGEFEDVVAKLDQIEEVDLVYSGCPHCSLDELKPFLEKKTKVETWACTSREVAGAAERSGLARALARRGVKLWCDTCPVVAVWRMGYSAIGTDSGKASHYAPTLGEVKVHFAPMERLLA